MIRVRIDNQVYTLITIVSETVKKTVGSDVKAIAYVFDKDRKVHKFPAEEIVEVEK